MKIIPPTFTILSRSLTESVSVYGVPIRSNLTSCTLFITNQAGAFSLIMSTFFKQHSHDSFFKPNISINSFMNISAHSSFLKVA